MAVLSYNGSGNLPAARLLANMISDMRPDARIIMHRDRDFRTEFGMQFELAIADAERRRNNIIGVNEVFTPLNDVEHSFAQGSHLKEVFHNLDPALIDAAIIDVTVLMRDELVNAARTAREQIRSSIYVPRKRAKSEWGEVGMPSTPPPIADFILENGLVPVSFEHTHGKMLMDRLRPKIHHHVRGSSQEVDEKICRTTELLEAASWVDVFKPTSGDSSNTDTIEDGNPPGVVSE